MPLSPPGRGQPGPALPGCTCGRVVRWEDDGSQNCLNAINGFSTQARVLSHREGALCLGSGNSFSGQKPLVQAGFSPPLPPIHSFCLLRVVKVRRGRSSAVPPLPGGLLSAGGGGRGVQAAELREAGTLFWETHPTHTQLQVPGVAGELEVCVWGRGGVLVCPSSSSPV